MKWDNGYFNRSESSKWYTNRALKSLLSSNHPPARLCKCPPVFAGPVLLHRLGAAWRHRWRFLFLLYALSVTSPHRGHSTVLLTGWQADYPPRAAHSVKWTCKKITGKWSPLLFRRGRERTSLKYACLISLEEKREFAPLKWTGSGNSNGIFNTALQISTHQHARGLIPSLNYLLSVLCAEGQASAHS